MRLLLYPTTEKYESITKVGFTRSFFDELEKLGAFQPPGGHGMAVADKLVGKYDYIRTKPGEPRAWNNVFKRAGAIRRSRLDMLHAAGRRPIIRSWPKNELWQPRR